MKKLNEIAFKVAELQAPMKVIVNYLDCSSSKHLKLKIVKTWR
ncbi:hypothetical protein N2D50_04165 [Enterococcus faecalis]|nr:hypothetical protein [Enterococcus faecalis]MCU2241458.1 hypothetical protein [Enterococcus faecalis]